ncbi:hypothetical protein D3C72_2448280 [compost metagenome]
MPMPTPKAITGSVATFTPIPRITMSASARTEVNSKGKMATTTARQDLKVMNESTMTAA